jgi:flagellar protein FliO/FliZ
MREMLEPVFGENGAVVAQFLITLAIILLVIGAAYWLVRRFAGVRFPGGNRGRIPRLAVIDAVPVDSRRRLVLVRRDNVEHLILIGGTSDLVVEPSIQRTSMAARRPPQAAQPQQAPQPASGRPAQPQQAAQPAPAPAPRPESTGISEPIPFPPQAAARPTRRAAAAQPVQAPPPEPAPQRRAATRPVPVPTEPLAAVAPPVIRPLAASAHFEEPARPSRIGPMLGEPIETVERVFEPPARHAPEPEPMPAPVAEEAEALLAEAPALVDEPAPPPAEETPTETPDISPEPAPAIAMEETDPDTGESPADEHDRAAKVSDLEREMARLLGEITSRRES